MSKTAAKKPKEDAEEETKAVATKANTNVGAPADIDFSASAGAGMEDMGADDLTIPRLNIIQSLSPQRSKSKPEYIEGADEGMIFDNVTKSLMDGVEGITVVPIKFQKNYIEWADRATGKGMVKHHGSDPTAYNETPPNDKYQRITPEGNEIVPTAEYFVFLVNEETGTYIPYVMSMSKSGIRHAKRWNSMASNLMAPHPTEKDTTWDCPLYFGKYKLTAAPESNQQGDWFRWEISPDGTLYDLPESMRWDLYRAAEAFRDSLQKGDVKVHEPTQQDTPEEESDEDPM